jgi:hypothetical protein
VDKKIHRERGFKVTLPIKQEWKKRTEKNYFRKESCPNKNLTNGFFHREL